MKEIKKGEYGYDYDRLIESFEVEVLLRYDTDDYQGDTRLLVRDGQRLGLITFGWGSCSGCDALQAAEESDNPHAEVTQLRDEIWNGAHWEDSPDAMLAYMNAKDWSLDFGGEDLKKFVDEAKAMLADAVAAVPEAPKEER